MPTEKTESTANAQAGYSDRQIEEICQSNLQHVAPSSGIEEAILAAAAEENAAPVLHILPGYVRWGISAAAAALAIAFGIYTFLNTVPQRSDRLAQIDALVAVTQTQAEEFISGSPASEDEAIQALATRLLEFQGFSDDDFTSEEEVIPLPPSTTLQRHKTRVPPSKICV